MSFAFSLYVFIIQVNILFAAELYRTESDRKADFKGKEKGYSLSINVVESIQVTNAAQCAFKCMEHKKCKSYNYEHETSALTHTCELLDKVKAESASNYIARTGFTHYESDFYADISAQENLCKFGGTYIPTCTGYTCSCMEHFKGRNCDVYDGPPFVSCNEIQNTQPPVNPTYYFLTIGSKVFQVFCDNDWTLIARFSNTDNKNWMNDTGYFWYDRKAASGNVDAVDVNSDMISEAFWLVKGGEFRITKSDDNDHTALLTTHGNCLNGKTFREKISSYGLFKKDTVWASDQCLGKCTVTYSGDYTTVQGFSSSQCDGEIQNKSEIGFWCDYVAGDGAVMMIGGGGSACGRADHGIGITEEDDAKFAGTATNYDFGNDADYVPTMEYSLNLWVR